MASRLSLLLTLLLQRGGQEQARDAQQLKLGVGKLLLSYLLLRDWLGTALLDGGGE